MKIETGRIGYWIGVKVIDSVESPTYMRLNTTEECCWYMNLPQGFLAVDEEKARELEDAFNLLQEEIRKETQSENK
jgi:hypothetical protein